MPQNLKKIIEHENDNWSRIFNVELSKKSAEHFSSFWWESYYKEVSYSFNSMMHRGGFKDILEAGSGSGKATILLDNKFNKTLLDISSVALDYAKHIANKFNAEKVDYVNGNIFRMPFKNNSYDLVWNIGVVEHYRLGDVKQIMKEMIRVTNSPGIVAVGIPNYHSGPILKARLLKNMKFLPGYRLDTERFYKSRKIEDMLRTVSGELGKEVAYIETMYFGSPLIIETPRFIMAALDPLISRLFRKNKFLIMVVCKFE